MLANWANLGQMQTFARVSQIPIKPISKIFINSFEWKGKHYWNEIVTLCSFSVTIFLLCHFSVTFTVIFVPLWISFVLVCHFFVTFYLKKILGVTSQSPTDSLSCSSLFCHFMCHFFVILCVTFSSLWIPISITRTYRTLY